MGTTKHRTPEQLSSDFWKRVNRGAQNECWEWMGGRASRKAHMMQYGVVWNNGKRWKTHRFAFVDTNGPIASIKTLVCHTCDNPPCCNPSHLFLGTHQDNALDCRDKGRLHIENGTARYNATLDDEKVRFIRENYSFRGRDGGMTAKQLSEKFGVGRSMISSITNNHRWKHVL